MPIVLVLLAVLNVSGCCIWKNIPESEADKKTFYVSSNGWHSSIILPKEYLSKSLCFVKNDLGDFSYYEFGWGDKGFYQSKEITSGLTMQAVFWPSESVIHTVAFNSHPLSYFESNSTIKMTVSAKGLNRLCEFMFSSFRKNELNEAVKSKAGIYGISLFYKGKGNYWLMNTCNTWTAEALAETGAPVSSFMTIRAGNVISQAEEAVKALEDILKQRGHKQISK